MLRKKIKKGDASAITRQDTSTGKDFPLLKLNFNTNTSRKKCKVGQHQDEHCVKKTKQSKNQNQP